VIYSDGLTEAQPDLLGSRSRLAAHAAGATTALEIVDRLVALATASGVGLAALWVQQTLPCLLGWVLELHLPYRELPVLAALTVAVAGVAAMVPARRAGRLEPGLALRQE